MRTPGTSFAALPKGPGQLAPPRPPRAAGADFVTTSFRAPRPIWIGGVMRTLVPVAALTGVYVGSTYYWPDGYASVPAPRCRGVTYDGCHLHWRPVEMQGGGSEVQCVKLCPRAGATAPPRTAAMMIVEPPVVAAAAPAACQVTIFAEPNFAGMSVANGENQPRLDEAGWQNQIASLQVNSGTWDFYSDPDFAGEVLRLRPGTYGDLGTQWTKHIGSLMCVEQ